MPNLLKKWQWFGQWSIGCVGVLGDWIVETVDALCREGKSELTVKALENHALQPDQRARMEMEARTGEHRVARAKAQSERELAQFLGNPLQDTKTTPIPTPSTDHGNSNGRIGRAPDRDPVGDQAPVIATKKCSFSGIIDIPVQQYQDSGIDRIECPDCQARRQVTPHNGILRFLTHDKRKTPGPQSEQRWVKREAGWEVILSKKK